MATNLLSQNPIGIFDSGVGGLTVAHAVTKLLPYENVIYFGDTAHFPYGNHSSSAIEHYAKKITDFLLSQQCKLILIACNTASTAYPILLNYIGKQALLIDVISPTIKILAKQYTDKKLGLIATQRTVDSNLYEQQLKLLAPNASLTSLATPLLAPMIEAGFTNNKPAQDLIASYLNAPQLNNIEVLVLACTHYPLISASINSYYQTLNQPVELIDSANFVAQTTIDQLTQTQLLNNNKQTPFRRFYLSDYTESFVKTASLFFPGSLQFIHHPLWN